MRVLGRNMAWVLKCKEAGQVASKAVPSSRIRLMLSSKCPGVRMISPSTPKRDRNPRLPRKRWLRLFQGRFSKLGFFRLQFYVRSFGESGLQAFHLR